VTGFLIGLYHSILSGIEKRRFCGSSAAALRLMVFLRVAFRPFLTPVARFI
jgi:hypothetical protein